MIPPFLKSSKQSWRALSRKAPARAGDLAYQRFSTPLLSERRTDDHAVLVERARRHLRNAEHRMLKTCEGWVRTYTFEPLVRASASCACPLDDDHSLNHGTDKPGQFRGAEPKTVILIHGWTSEASFMSAIAESLRRAGFRVVLFDMPAHGLSPGTHTNIIVCTRVLIDVIDALGPVDYAVSHSMGGLAALLAAGGDKPYKRACILDGYVFISTPNDFRDVTREFADGLGLTPAARRHYERHLERVAHQDLSKLSSANYLNMIDRPALMIHSRDDDEIRVTNAEQVVAACPKAEFKPVDGVGHRRILYASDVTREATKFLSRLSAAQEPATHVKSTVNATKTVMPSAGQHVSERL